MQVERSNHRSCIFWSLQVIYETSCKRSIYVGDEQPYNMHTQGTRSSRHEYNCQGVSLSSWIYLLQKLRRLVQVGE
jgi:hypothetical protein